MKHLVSRTILWLIALAFLFSAVSCKGPENGSQEPETGSAGSGSAETQDAPKTDGVFKAGYAREDITPGDGLPLAGFGNTDKRLSYGFLDFTYLTCIAFLDGEGNTLLWFSQDLINCNADATKKLKEMVTAETGVPRDHILVTATHTHSSVDQSQTGMDKVNQYIAKLQNAAVKAAAAAIADLRPATFSFGTADLTGYNYVRHYFTDLDESVGDNHGALAKGTINRHTTEANSEMQILVIGREDAKDILLTNWRAHPTITGGLKKQDVSADFVGSIRNEIEKKTDYLFVYYQGDAGNMNPRTLLSPEVEFNPPSEVKEYGKEVAGLILKSLEETPPVEIKTGTIQTVETTFTGDVNHDWDDKMAVAQELFNYWQETSDYAYVYQRGSEYGIESPYHAGAIVSRTSMGRTLSIEIHATRIGDFAFINAPLELFDTNGDYVRENSPTKYTMVVGYSNETHDYLPSQYGYEYGCYESDTSKFKPGTGEVLASEFVSLLNDLFK